MKLSEILDIPDDIEPEKAELDAVRDIALFFNAENDVLMGSEDPADYAAAHALETLSEADARTLEELVSRGMLDRSKAAGGRSTGTQSTKGNAVDRLARLKQTAWKVMDEHPEYLRGIVCDEIADRCGGNARYIQGQLKSFFDDLKK